MRMAVVVVLLAIGGFVSTGELALGQGKSSSAKEPITGRVLNVLDYGAVGDDKTDNTAAFSACLQALLDAGGGKMFLPDGVYRGAIVFPAIAEPGPSWMTVEIVGESEPTPVFGTIGAFSLSSRGTILKSLAKEGPAVISVTRSPNALYGDFSPVNVIIRNLDVRTSDNPGISGIDLYYAVQCKLENVFINTGVYNVQASKPTARTCGLITPACNNGALTVLRNLVVTGYHTGIQVNEHTDGDNLVVASNLNGLEFVQAHHASRFGRVGAYRNAHHITVTGGHGFSIQQFNTEMPGAGQTNEANAWQTLISDVRDPQNLAMADINYWVVLGGTGAVEQFIKEGGASIRTRRIGSAGFGELERQGEQPQK